MNLTHLNTTQSLTGQAKVQSLNTIYNRVTLLKSKNVNRKLIHRDSSLSNQINTLNDEPFFSNKIRGLDESHISVNSIINKQKFLDDKETDNLQTNFWSSQGNAQINPRIIGPMKQKVEGNPTSQIKQRRRFVSTNQALNKISKTTTNKPQYQSNRVFLMSDFRRNHGNETTAIEKESKKVDKIQKKSRQGRKRPLTSSVGRQNISFRINELSRSKQLLKQNNTPSEQLNAKSSLSRIKKEQTASKKSLTGSRVSLIKGETRVNTYKKQIQKFQELYECLSGVLGSIKQGIEQVEKAVSRYANLIQSKRLSFIDDFMDGRQPKLQKLVRATRLHETLSICYLFLQIAQERIQDNESYLVNFIGHSLSNLLLVIRLYMRKQRKTDFEQSQFQMALTQMQISSYGEELYQVSDIQVWREKYYWFERQIGKTLSIQHQSATLLKIPKEPNSIDILLRIQHNSEIITMIHKRLGRNNEKFETCIKNFFKNADREKYSCSLCAHYIFEFLSMHIHELQMLDISPSLQLAPQPYTPPAEKEYTLVIEPLGILQRNDRYRPYLNQFMKWAVKNFDIVLWTWELPYAVEDIYETLSPYLTSRLYRHHCRVENEVYVKDLSRLGRNLQKTIIMDFDKRIFGHHLNNGIECRWKGNQNDKNLLVLSQIFEEMISSATSIQDTLTFYAEEILSIRGY